MERIRAQRGNIFDFSLNNSTNPNSNNNDNDDNNMDVENGGDNIGTGGISRDDPMLAWASLHQAAGLREADS